MKPFRLFEIPVLLRGLGTALVLSPRSRAQSEIAPDHFDGPDPSEAAEEKATRPKIQQAPKADFDATRNLASARHLVKPVPRGNPGPTQNDHAQIKEAVGRDSPQRDFPVAGRSPDLWPGGRPPQVGRSNKSHKKRDASKKLRVVFPKSPSG